MDRRPVEGAFMELEDCLAGSKECKLDTEDRTSGVMRGSGDSGRGAVAAATACSHLMRCGEGLSGDCGMVGGVHCVPASLMSRLC